MAFNDIKFSLLDTNQVYNTPGVLDAAEIEAAHNKGCIWAREGQDEEAYNKAKKEFENYNNSRLKKPITYGIKTFKRNIIKPMTDGIKTFKRNIIKPMTDGIKTFNNILFKSSSIKSDKECMDSKDKFELPDFKWNIITRKKQNEQQNVSFFDEAWSGHQIARLTGDNFITDWLQNKDKVCTDGKDDGKLSIGQYALSFAKGLIGGIPKAIINHPVATAITAGLGAGAVALTGGAILPVLTAVGIVAGVGMIGYGTYKAVTAKKDGDAKQALETMGMGVTTTALSVASADKALEKAAEAGVESARLSKDATLFDKTIQVFKSIPECLTKSKEWTLSYLKGTPVSIRLEDGTEQVKIKGKLTEETLADGTHRKYSSENPGVLREETFPNGGYKEYDKNGVFVKGKIIEEDKISLYENGKLSKEIFADGTYKKYSKITEGFVTEELLTDGTKINKYFEYNKIKGHWTKTTLKDGSYKVINESTGSIFEEKFPDGTIKTYYSSYKGMQGPFTKMTNADGTFRVLDSKSQIIEGQLPDGSIAEPSSVVMYTKDGESFSSYNGKFVQTRLNDGTKQFLDYTTGRVVKEWLPDGTDKYYFTQYQGKEGNFVRIHKPRVSETIYDQEGNILYEWKWKKPSRSYYSEPEKSPSLASIWARKTNNFEKKSSGSSYSFDQFTVDVEDAVKILTFQWL